MPKQLLALATAVFMCILPASATTIVWDGHYLAADSQATMGTRPIQIATKIYYSRRRHAYIGCAGAVVSIQKVIKWFLESNSAECPVICPPGNDDLGYVYLMVDRNGKLLQHTSHDGMVEDLEITQPMSIGSGSPYAMAAMLLGCNAMQAVFVASRLDECTGGNISYYDVAGKSKELKKFDPLEK
jgi:ATP-dependent protease HslVU (ClpYQ) peptidase subunit